MVGKSGGPALGGKAVAVILGLIIVVLSWHAYYWSFFNCVIRYDGLWHIDNLLEEQVFMYTTLIVLILSIISFIMFAVRNFRQNGENQGGKANIVDFGFHLVCAIALLIVGSLMIYSTIDIEYYKCVQVESYLFYDGVLEWVAGTPCQLYYEKMAAGVIALLTGIIYGITGFLIIALPSY